VARFSVRFLGCKVSHTDAQAIRERLLADEARQRETRLAVAEAAEVDARQHDLAVALRDTTADLGEHVGGPPAARAAADERDHAEGAREGAAVLDLDEGADPVEPRLGPHAADRADVARDGSRGLLRPPGDDDDVLRQARERAGEVGRAAGDVDAAVIARGA
jgi:hypothetical protein